MRQRGLGERVREVVGIRVVQLLVEEVDHAGRHARVRRLRAHLRGERLRERDRGGGVAAHQRLEQGGVERGRAVVFETRRAVDHRVDAAERLRDRGQQRGSGGGVGEIGGEQVHAGAGGAQLGGRGFGLGERVRVGAAVMQRDVEAGVRQLQRNHAPDAARGAGDQRHRARAAALVGAPMQRALERLFGVRVVGVGHDPYNLIRCSEIPGPDSRAPRQIPRRLRRQATRWSPGSRPASPRPAAGCPSTISWRKRSTRRASATTAADAASSAWGRRAAATSSPPPNCRRFSAARWPCRCARRSPPAAASASTSSAQAPARWPNSCWRRWTPTTPTTTACCACRWTTRSSSSPRTCASASRRASRASRRACSGSTPGPARSRAWWWATRCSTRCP